MFSGLDFFFHSRSGPIFLFVYNTIRAIEFTLKNRSWILFQPPTLKSNGRSRVYNKTTKLVSGSINNKIPNATSSDFV